jgi:bifunctional non-homologous end joining protein LigD
MKKLGEYQKKRQLDKTPEPSGGNNQGPALHFVVQKHDASRLHYDFRLEMKGVLKSWAVPKGPSLNPTDKRLAMMVEDHPYDYKDFEGIIPKGHYGAGTVIVWDEGTYQPIENLKSKAAIEKSLLKQLKEGSLKFRLKGKKLRGEFALVKTRGMAPNAWLLIKHRDEYASEVNITEKEKSVKTGKTIEQTEAALGKKKLNNSDHRPSPAKGENDKPKNVGSFKITGSVQAILRKSEQKSFPRDLSPMLATPVAKAFDDDQWEFEIKWDGYRALAFRKGKITEIKSRNNQSFDKRFYPIYNALKKWKIEAVLDGEIVVTNQKGISQFSALQNWHEEDDGKLQYYLFDVLWFNGKSLISRPFKERNEVLKSIVPDDHDILRLGFSVLGRGISFLNAAKEAGLEGIIAKRVDSLYFPGTRSNNWLKIKLTRRQEVIIIGYTHNPGSPRPFSALLLGMYRGKTLSYAGKAGTGFNDQEQKEMLRKFKPLIIDRSPLNETHINGKLLKHYWGAGTEITWLKPRLVCEVGFTEVTDEGLFRHPSFKGFREDKPAKDVTRESMDVPVSETAIPRDNNRPPKAKPDDTRKEGKGQMTMNSRLLADDQEEIQTKVIRHHRLQFTNLNKNFWIKEKISKRDLLNYYDKVSGYILPYLTDRPQSLYRFPDGYQGKSFYQKDVTELVPGWADTYKYTSKTDRQDKRYLVVKDEATLMYMVNLGCIEMNPWSSTVKKPDYPDWCLLDLDPGTKTSFNQVVEVAKVIRTLLEHAEIPTFPKTSGATGMHIYIPLGAKYTYEQSREFGRLIMTLVHHETSRYTTLERSTDERRGKLYLDFLQNRSQATLASPYSVRPRPKATVSMPLHWDEVKKGLKVDDFTLRNVPELLEERGDLFKGTLGKGIDMTAALKRLKIYAN